MPQAMKKEVRVKGENKRIAALRAHDAGDVVRVDAMAAADNKTVDIYIYDVIGWPYIEAADLLYRIPPSAEKIRVHLNTPGGDVFEGMAIYNMLANHAAEVEVIVEALAASSGSLIAMAGDTITMRAASFLMIHNVWSSMAGDADALRAEADLLDKINAVFVSIYAGRTGKKGTEIAAMMAAETWFTPEEAASAGFADGPADGDPDSRVAFAAFDISAFCHAPEALRAASALNNKTGKARDNHNHMEASMKKELRALLERLGLATDATEDQAWAFLADIDLETIPEEKERKAVTDAKKKAPAQPDKPAPATAADIQAALAAERRRVSEIREAVRVAGLPESFADSLVDGDTPVDAARAAIFAEMKKKNPPVAAGAYIEADERDKFRAAAVDGIGFRCGIRPEKPAPGHEVFRSASMEYIARTCLDRAGIGSSQFASRDDVARAVLRMASAGGFTTGDFSSIFLDVSHKVLLKAYQEAAATWRPIVNVVSAADFKEMYGVSLSEAPDLELINERGEYKSGEMSDNREHYRVFSYGKIVYLTRPMIVNDDLRAFTRLPQLLGAAARRKESDLVWALIISNPTMNDDTALFHADHGNLEAVADNIGAVDTDNLSAARAAMRKQTAPGGSPIDLTPRFLLTPVSQETDTDIILRSTALPSTDMSAGVHNPWAGKLTPISDPRMDVDSELAWYLVADPNQVDTIEVAYLDGVEEPRVEEGVPFDRDAVGFKVTHDFGCGVMDHRGFYKNPGE